MSKINFGDLAYVLEDQTLNEANINLRTAGAKYVQAAAMVLKTVDAFAKDVLNKLHKLRDHPNPKGWKIKSSDISHGTEAAYITFVNGTEELTISWGFGRGEIRLDYKLEGQEYMDIIDPTSNAVVQYVASNYGGPPDG